MTASGPKKTKDQEHLDIGQIAQRGDLVTRADKSIDVAELAKYAKEIEGKVKELTVDVKNLNKQVNELKTQRKPG